MAILKNCVGHYAGRSGFRLSGQHELTDCKVMHAEEDGFNFTERNPGDIQATNCEVEYAGRYAFHSNDPNTTLEETIKCVESEFPEIRQILRNDKLSFIENQIEELKRELASPKPNQGFVRSSLQSLRTIFEGASGNLVAEGINSSINAALRYWGG
jgi:hypothetical protein